MAASSRLKDVGMFTDREYQCLRYIQKGYSAKMIAREFNISPRTVEHHLAHIRYKLNVSSIKAIIALF